MKKHSVSIRGHSTSFSLEDQFWDELKLIAKRNNQSIAHLVTQIDAKRSADENLSSALRLFVLAHVKLRAEKQS
ncbi:ribbon-helix-helix domain-containing protein [Pseudahrensia aquimaris]|uniref:Ribbon-helix-helix domain-containing protein n=1 Tax=Pseudahrensia aquimaris TaxID=744461 RepID=A0ABW3FLL4_9HYPH